MKYAKKRYYALIKQGLNPIKISFEAEGYEAWVIRPTKGREVFFIREIGGKHRCSWEFDVAIPSE